MSGPELQPWQRPPFEPGNRLAEKHGATSPAAIEPRAQELLPQLLEANPHLDAQRDQAALYRYAVNLARIERVYDWLSRQPDPVFADPRKGETHRVFERLDRWEREAASAEHRLAITPLTRARLGLHKLAAQAALADRRGVLEELLAEGRRVLDERAGEA